METHSCINLPDLPTEIHQIIILVLDDKSKRYMRCINTYWFNMINYNEFTIYFARVTTLPEMVDRFAKHEGPIALRFKKEIRMDAYMMAKELQRLTNLTRLSMSKNVRSIPISATRGGYPFEQFNKLFFAPPYSLSRLTNLQEWHDMPSFGVNHFEMLSNFSHLTKLKLHGGVWNKETLERIILNNTGLEALDLNPVLHQHNQELVDLISILPNPSRLTSLIMPYNYAIKDEDYTRLFNLCHIKMDRGGLFRTLTALESLETQGHFVAYFDINTILTSLKIASSSDEILKTSLPNLVNLHELVKLGRIGRSIDVPLYLQPGKLTRLHIMQEVVDKLDNMSRLTNLVELLIVRERSDEDQENLELLMNLTKLTQLRLHCDLKTNNSPFITKLTNLKSLILRGDMMNFMEADVAPLFSNLEELRFGEYFADSFSTHTQALHTPDCYHTILLNFKNLTRLQIHNQTPDLFKTLTKLSNLKTLTVGSMNAKDMPALTNLMALTDLDINQSVSDDHREIFAKLTNLQRLWLTRADKKNKDYYYSKFPYLHSFGYIRPY